MTLTDFFRNVLGGEPRSEEAVGTIIQGPIVQPGVGDPPQLIFWLDSCPEVEFRQAVTPLAAERHRGDRVKVCFHRDPDEHAVVDWVERL